MVRLLLGMWNDPARPARPVIHITGDISRDHQRQLRRLFVRRGWEVRLLPQPIASGDVGIEMVPAERSEATEFDPRWPLRVSQADLEEGSVFERLLRRDELQHRRKIVKGLKKLLKQAMGHPYVGGTGFWLAPHLWFVPGMARDEVPEEHDDHTEGAFLTQTIGTPYHRLFSRATRHHLYRMLRALQVDLIFIEDSVTPRKLTRVLRTMFEVYDRTRGERRVEDIHFRGLTGLRVMLHEFELDEPFRSEVYPEPRFDDFSRARILHIFRDRGGQEDYVEPPFDFSHSPAPLLLGS
jgi:hypothetical protein